MEHHARNYILAIDGETSGPSFKKNALLSLGVTLQDDMGNEHKSFQANIKIPEGKGFDPLTQATFWDKNPEALAFVQTNPQGPFQAMKAFKTFLDDLDHLPGTLTIISDNPSFDVAWIDYYLDMYADRRPLRYSADGRHYRMVWDAASVQKMWLCIKNQLPDLRPPRGHRRLLGLKSTVPHDHNPLNDARAMAQYYLQTKQQITKFIQGQSPRPQPKIIKLDPYNENWPRFFAQEKDLIQSALADLCLGVHHVGSTSVPGMVAKPIIDIIAVVPKGQPARLIDKAFAEAGYDYKGNYNLPFRRLYKKKGLYTVYLHVHPEDSAEIQLNLMFRDYLIKHSTVAKKYADLKKAILKDTEVHVKAGPKGVTTYNLRKNDFIASALKAAGFDGLCMRFCTHDNEWAAYDMVRQEVFRGKTREGDPETMHSLVLYQGTDIIAVGAVDMSLPRPAVKFVASTPGVKDPADKEKARNNLMMLVKRWLKTLGH